MEIPVSLRNALDLTRNSDTKGVVIRTAVAVSLLGAELVASGIAAKMLYEQVLSPVVSNSSIARYLGDDQTTEWIRRSRVAQRLEEAQSNHGAGYFQY